MASLFSLPVRAEEEEEEVVVVVVVAGALKARREVAVASPFLKVRVAAALAVAPAEAPAVSLHCYSSRPPIWVRMRTD